MSRTPESIRPGQAQTLNIAWSTGETTQTSYHLLRAQCPCAGCVNEMTGERMIDESTIPTDIRPTGVTVLGRYAIQIQWSDGHATGIYHFDRLWEVAHAPPRESQPARASGVPHQEHHGSNCCKH